LIIVGVFVAIVGIIVAVFGVLGTFNWWRAKKYNEEMKKEVEKIKEDFSSMKENIKGLKDNLKEQIENQIKELEELRKRDFTRNHISYQATLDKDTLNILNKFANELGQKNIFPYLEEFYKRITRPSYIDWWNKLTTEAKINTFKDIMYQIDNKWFETMFPKKE